MACAAAAAASPPALDEEQLHAVELCLKSHVFVLLGEPGTGKTTVVAEIYRRKKLEGRRVLILGPTAKAASRARALVVGGAPACTADKLTQSSSAPTAHARWRHAVVIMDEASMAYPRMICSVLRTLAEITAIHTQYPENLRFSTNACGSSYRMRENGILERIPAIYICNQQPTATWNTLDKNRVDCVNRPWVTPSCIERMGNLGLMTYIQRRYWRVRRERK